MNKKLGYVAFAIVIVTVLFTACHKSSNNSNNNPNANNFLAYAQRPYVIGERGTVVVTSTSLAAGDYTVKYRYTGLGNNQPVMGQSASLTISGHIGTFQTPVLTDSDVMATYVTIDSIINANGGATKLTSNNLVTLSDSTGFMDVSIPFTYTFRALYVSASYNSSSLIINGEYYFPGSTDHYQLYVVAPNSGTGTYNFYNFFVNGECALFKYNNNGAVTDSGVHGTIVISTLAPTITGNFSATFTDSTTVSGSFNCPKL